MSSESPISAHGEDALKPPLEPDEFISLMSSIMTFGYPSDMSSSWYTVLVNVLE